MEPRNIGDRQSSTKQIPQFHNLNVFQREMEVNIVNLFTGIHRNSHNLSSLQNPSKFNQCKSILLIVITLMRQSFIPDLYQRVLQLQKTLIIVVLLNVLALIVLTKQSKLITKRNPREVVQKMYRME